MKRRVVAVAVVAIAASGCTGGGRSGATPAGSSGAGAATSTARSGSPTAGATAPAAGADATAASPSATGTTTTTASAGPTASAPASSTPSPTASPAPTGPVTAAQAAQIEKHFDAVQDKGIVARDPKVLATVEGCAVLPSESADAEAERATGYVPKGYAGDHTTFVPAAFIEPASTAYPQQFLFVENYRRPQDDFTPYSMNVFVRASPSSSWKLCRYPNLYAKQPLPAFATVATNVVPVVPAASVAKARHAAGALAAYLTRRSSAKVGPPKGLTVPFGGCPAKHPSCNPSGLLDPYFTHTNPQIATTTVYRTTSQPVFAYPLAGGDTLAIAQLATVRTSTAVGSGIYLLQDAKRTKWDFVVPPGEFHTITQTWILDVVLRLTPAGSATLIGSVYEEQPPSTTPR